MEQWSDAPGCYLRREDMVFRLIGVNPGLEHLTQAVLAASTSYNAKPSPLHWPLGYRI